MKQKDWEYDNIFTEQQPGDTQKEYITYRRVGDRMHRIRVVRKYFGSGDYQDSVESVVL